MVRDEHGIAQGGIRLPQADVPLAQNSAIPLAPGIWASLRGSSHPFSKEKILALYGDQVSFLAQFEQADHACSNCANLLAQAEATWPT